MLSGIFDVIKGIGEFISNVVGFILDFIKDIVYIITLLGETIVSIPQYFGWLPAAVVSLILALFAIAVVYKITGREG